MSDRPEDSDGHGEPRDNLKAAVSTAVIEATDPISRLEVSAYELSTGLADDVTPDDVHSVLETADWAYPQEDGKHAWMFDRHIVFADSIDDVVSSYPDRYEDGDFR